MKLTKENNVKKNKMPVVGRGRGRPRRMPFRNMRKYVKRSRKTMVVSKKPAWAQVHHFRRNVNEIGPIVGNAAYIPYTNATGVTFNQLINSTEFTSLYDQYRINYVVDKYWLKIDPSAQAAASASFPKMYICRDLDDGAVPANLNELRERNNCVVKVMNPNRPVVYKFKPNVLDSIYRTGITDGSSTPKWKVWIDCSLPDLSHYGYKYAIDDLTNTNYRVTIERTIYFSCKNVR